MPDNVVLIGGFLSYTIGIVVYLAGMRINERIHFLRALNVPEPVTGGMAASLIGLAVYLFLGIELEYALNARDVLLVYFFTTIGINAGFSDLLSGGRRLLLLLGLTWATLFFKTWSPYLVPG